eukprot:TRINITY_DN51_c0_g2_i5.p1 TRINITY_DN51_c0_g2~~TRINITY_DN51_c0_g2_i5.p1  ORF type:complete len:706 (+),score=187.88 TRINITY_DN51_c0_g2_i5:214-2331(+)
MSSSKINPKPGHSVDVLQSPEQDPTSKEKAIEMPVTKKLNSPAENSDRVINSTEKPVRLKGVPQMSSEARRIRVQLTWKDIYVWPKPDVTCRDCRNVETLFDENKRIILRNVSGTVKPGEFLSIIGSTGAGKTTLLQLLSGKMFPQNLAWKGSIEINEEDRSLVEYSRFTAFVQQDDILMENFTVEECLTFAANVKSAGDEEVKRYHVNGLLEELELTESKDIKFGSDLLRKGERKRASIGVELITNPSLLFVDEPTTGMDTFTAGKLVELMGKLAKRGRTIIATIHQPNSEIYAMFDKLMILALGRIAYFNTAKDAVQYFSRLGYVCPKQTNPAEHFMKILSAENFMKPDDVGDTLAIAKKRYEEAVVAMSESYESPENDMKCQVDVMAPQVVALSKLDLSSLKYVAPWLVQFVYLFKRASINNIRSPHTTIVRFVTTVAVMLLGTGLYYDQDYEGYEAMQGRVGTQFYMLTFCLLEAIQNVILVFPEERAVFLREQASSLYDISAYFMGKIIAEFPLNLLIPIISLLICYWSWNMNDAHGYNFWINLLNMELMYFCGTGFGLIMGSIVADRTILVTLLAIVSMPLQLFSGFFVSIDKSKHIMWVLQYISPCKYIFATGMRNEFEDSELTIQMVGSDGKPTIVNGDYVLTTFELDPYSWWENYLAVACILVGTHAIAFLLLLIFGKRVCELLTDVNTNLTINCS